MFSRIVRLVGVLLCGFLRNIVQVVCREMNDMVSKFTEGLALTIEKQRIVVINDQESALLRTDKVFLVGRVLTQGFQQG